MAQTFTAPAGTDSQSVAILTRLTDRDEALRTLHSGATEPSSIVADMLWVDTTANQIKKRNAANNAWIAILPRDNTIRTLHAYQASGAIAAGELQFAAPTAMTIEKIVIVPNTATTGSSEGSKAWTWALRNVTAAADLFSSTVATSGTTGGVGGGELAADTAYTLTPNQNATVAANAVLRFTVAAVGSPTAVSDASIVLVATTA